MQSAKTMYRKAEKQENTGINIQINQKIRINMQIGRGKSAVFFTNHNISFTFVSILSKCLTIWNLCVIYKTIRGEKFFAVQMGECRR